MPETTTPQVGDTVTIVHSDGRRFDGGQITYISPTGAKVVFVKDGTTDVARRHRDGRYYRTNPGIVNPISEVVFERPAPSENNSAISTLLSRRVHEGVLAARRSLLSFEKQAALSEHRHTTLQLLDEELYALYLKAVRDGDNAQDVYQRLLFTAAYGLRPEESGLFVGFEADLRERAIKDLKGDSSQ